jgi:hypothetical protein
MHDIRSVVAEARARKRQTKSARVANAMPKLLALPPRKIGQISVTSGSTAYQVPEIKGLLSHLTALNENSLPAPDLYLRARPTCVSLSDLFPFPSPNIALDLVACTWTLQQCHRQ